jgi:hypothetical protein
LGWLHLSLGRKWLGFSINDMQIFLMPLFHNFSTPSSQLVHISSHN